MKPHSPSTAPAAPQSGIEGAGTGAASSPTAAPGNRPLRVAHGPDATLPAHSDPALLRFFWSGEAAGATRLPAVPLANVELPADAAAPCAARQVLQRLQAQLGSARAAAREPLRAQCHTARAHLSDLLRADAAGQDGAVQAQSIADTVGGHIDIAQLTARLPRPRGPVALSATARERMAALVQRLADAEQALAAPALQLFVGTGAAAPARWDPADEGAEIDTSETPLRRAVAWAQVQLAAQVELGRALRAAELELQHTYDAARHGAILAGLSGADLTDAERRALPVALVVVDPAHAEAQLPPLLDHDLPVQVLLLHPPQAALQPPLWGEPAYATRAWLAARATVVQASPVAPEHLRAGLALLAQATGPALLSLCAPGPEAADREQAARWLQTGAFPLYTFDPGQPPASQLQLYGDAAAGQDAWAQSTLACADGAGLPVEVTQHWTPADLLAASHTDALWPLAAGQWAADQLPVADYLRGLDAGTAREELPFVWVLDGHGGLQRAVVARAWLLRIRAGLGHRQRLRELAGLDNPFAAAGFRAGQAAAERAHTEAQAAAEQRQQAQLQAARRQGASEAVDRIVHVLSAAGLAGIEAGAAVGNAAAHGDRPPQPSTAAAAAPMPHPEHGGTPAPAPQTSSSSAPAVPAAAPALAAPAPAAGAVPAADADFGDADEPFVDSRRCTTCNECTQRFPDVFAYDDNRQAYLSNPGTAPFAALVAAAEKCPAKCIFPGAPRPDDDSATAEVRARAEALG